MTIYTMTFDLVRGKAHIQQSAIKVSAKDVKEAELLGLMVLHKQHNPFGGHSTVQMDGYFRLKEIIEEEAP